MKKTRTDLSFLARMLFETSELFTEIIIVFRNSIMIWRKDIHARSRYLASIEGIENEVFEGHARAPFLVPDLEITVPERVSQ